MEISQLELMRRKKISEASKKHWQDPAFRAKTISKMKEVGIKRMKRVPVNCSLCMVEHFITPSRKAFWKLHFCSKECKYEYTKKHYLPIATERVKELRMRGIKIGGPQKGIHNSLSTEFKSGPDHVNWVGGTEKYRGSDWRVQRKKALERDNFKCRRCDISADLTIHHKKPYRISHDNSLSNLITFCRRCHIVNERGLSKIHFDGGDSITITHVPGPTMEKFLSIAQSEFAGNTGFTLKWLVDMVLPEQSEVYLKMAELEDRITKLESNSHQKETKEEKKAFMSPSEALKRIKGEENGDKSNRQTLGESESSNIQK